MIQLKHLSKSFDHVVLNDINLTLEKGKIYVIKGISGCGKTTLLNILSGLDKDYDGEMYVNGVERKSMNNSQSYEYTNKIGYMMQKSLLFKNLTVSENLMFIEKNENKIKRYSELFKIAHLLHKKPDKLSGGERQRASLIRALLNNNEIIICDEPTSSLDKKNANAFVEYLKQINISDKIVIIASHKEIYDTFADEIIYLENGKVKRINKNNEKDISGNFLETEDEGNVDSKNLKDDYSYIKKNKKRTNILTGCFLFVMFLLLFFTLSIKQNYREQVILQQLNTYPYDLIDFPEEGVEKYEDIIEKVYRNYIVSETDYKAYSLFDKQDSVFKDSKCIKYGNFPEKENDVLVNAEFIQLKYPDRNIKEILNTKINISDKEFMISGIIQHNENNYNKIYKFNEYYSEIYDYDTREVKPAVFIPYESIQKIDNVKIEETKYNEIMVKIKNEYIGELYNEDLSMKDESFMGSLYAGFYSILGNKVDDAQFYANISVIASIITGILAIIFIANQINLDLFYRKKEIGYLQLFHISKLEVSYIIVCQYLLGILKTLGLALIVYAGGIYHYYLQHSINLLLSPSIILITSFFLMIYCIFIVSLPLIKILRKDIIYLLKS